MFFGNYTQKYTKFNLKQNFCPSIPFQRPIHLDYRWCKSSSPTMGLSGIRTLARKMGSQRLVHYAKIANLPQLLLEQKVAVFLWSISDQYWFVFIPPLACWNWQLSLRSSEGEGKRGQCNQPICLCGRPSGRNFDTRCVTPSPTDGLCESLGWGRLTHFVGKRL